MAYLENELPIALDDLPNFQLRQVEGEGIQNERIQGMSAEKVQYEVAKDFLLELERLITSKTPDLNALYALYDYKFNAICQKVFKENAWPTAAAIEEYIDGREITINTQLLYHELCTRHILARLKKNQTPVEEVTQYKESWDNYLQIFETVQIESEQLALPCAWIWDIIDEFIYQYTVASKTRPYRNAPDVEREIEKIVKSSGGYWELETVEKILSELIEKSGVVQTREGRRVLQFNEKRPTLSYFAFYAIVGLVRLNSLRCDFERALQQVEPIDFDALKEYSKAVPSYITLFYYVGFCYLMSQRYYEAVKIFEAIVLFYHNYKTFLTKSFQQENMEKQAEKCLVLLALSLVFHPTQVEDAVIQTLKEQTIRTKKQSQNAEKLWDMYERVCKYEVQTFNELYQFGTPRLFSRQESAEPQAAQRILNEFENAKKLNNITSLLKLYPQIKLEKAAVLLSLRQEDLRASLEQYKKRNDRKIRENVSFEHSVLGRFLSNQVQVNFEIAGDTLRVTEVAPAKDYSKHFALLNSKIQQIYSEVEKITASKK